MDWHSKGIRIGAAVAVSALLLRLFGGSLVGAVVDTFSNADTVSMLMYLESGRVIRFYKSDPPVQTQPNTDQMQSTEPIPQETLPQEDETVAFEDTDASLVELHNYCGYEEAVQVWLEQPLDWDLSQQAPTVLIVHSHATESYGNTDEYEQSSAYRTLDTEYNVVSIGTALAQVLEAGGIGVVHDTTLHDYPSYSDSYGNSRKTVQQYLQEYPSIELVLDIHRDSVTDKTGKEMTFTVEYEKQDAAQLMLVVGTDAGGLTHPQWQSNMSLAVKLHAQLEKLCTGICRPISFRSQRFNQDLSAGALLIEVGAAGNTQQEALRSVEVLANAIFALSAGTQ